MTTPHAVVFVAHVCDVLDGIDEVLAAGPHTGLAHFQHGVRQHRPALRPQNADFQAVDHATDKQVVVLARPHA